MRPSNRVRVTEFDKYFKIIDYSINILSQKPNSAEAFNVVLLLEKLEFYENDIIKKIYTDLKEKHYASIDDLSSNMPEKFIILFLMFRGIEAYNSNSEADSLINFYNEKLINISNNCPNKDFAILSYVFLFYHPQKSLEYMAEFKNKFKSSPMLPMVDLNFIISSYHKNPEKAIEKITEWQKSFRDIMSPFGWKLEVEGYSAIASCYMMLKNVEKAREYLKKVIKEAPEYYEADSDAKLILNSNIKIK